MKDKLILKIVGSDEEYSQAMGIRRAVFVDEHQISADKEFDGNDHNSSHVLALDGDKPVGTMRIRYFNGFVKFERMCVLPEYRKTDVSQQIMGKGMIFAAQKGYEKIYGVCKKELLARWKREGFLEIPDAEPVKQNDMTLIPIYCPLPKVDNVISMKTAPEILNAREGDWDKVWENQSMRGHFKQMLEKVRFIRNAETQNYVPKKAPLMPDSPIFAFEILHQTGDKSN